VPLPAAQPKLKAAVPPPDGVTCSLIVASGMLPPSAQAPTVHWAACPRSRLCCSGRIPTHKLAGAVAAATELACPVMMAAVSTTGLPAAVSVGFGLELGAGVSVLGTAVGVSVVGVGVGVIVVGDGVGVFVDGVGVGVGVGVSVVGVGVGVAVVGVGVGVVAVGVGVGVPVVAVAVGEGGAVAVVVGDGAVEVCAGDGLGEAVGGWRDSHDSLTRGGDDAARGRGEHGASRREGNRRAPRVPQTHLTSLPALSVLLWNATFTVKLRDWRIRQMGNIRPLWNANHPSLITKRHVPPRRDSVGRPSKVERSSLSGWLPGRCSACLNQWLWLRSAFALPVREVQLSASPDLRLQTAPAVVSYRIESIDQAPPLRDTPALRDGTHR
jgi:hypothetical protein